MRLYTIRLKVLYSVYMIAMLTSVNHSLLISNLQGVKVNCLTAAVMTNITACDFLQ